MKYIIYFLKLFLDSIRDTSKIVKYFNLIKINGYFVIIKLFIIRFFYAFSFIRNIRKIKISENKELKPSFTSDSLDLNQEIKKIDLKGFSNTYSLKQNCLEKLRSEILDNKKNINIKKDYKIDLFKRDEENQIKYINRLKDNNISRLTGVLNLEDFFDLKKIVLSNEILEIVSNYIGSNTISINSTYFISLPLDTDKYEKYENAQFFHWDNDFTKFLKLYIYLSDVDDLSGPHAYVAGSHKNKKLDHSLTRLYSDKDIYSSYNDIKIFHGKEGSFFFTDSYGIHKGMSPTKNYRIMLNIHFGNNKIKYHKDDLIINI